MGNKTIKRRMSKEYIFSLWMIMPAMLIISLLVVYPVFEGVRLSFFKYNLMSRNRPFIGLGNYVKLLQNREVFLILWNTVFFAFSSNLISTALGLGVALYLNNSGKLTGSLRALGYLPWITPGVVYIFTWKWMFNKSFGPINAFLMHCGFIEAPISFLGDANLMIAGLAAPVFSVLLVRVWSSFPFKMTMFLAALQNIPKEHYEAARIDGANRWQQFIHIIIPVIWPVFLIVFSISMIWNLSHFDINYLLTNGGPKNLTNVMTIYIYNKAFIHYGVGEASAASMFVFVIAGFVGAIYMLINKKDSEL